jgi:hypothetical protein
MRSAAAHAVADVVDLAAFRRRREEQRMQSEETERVAPEQAASIAALPVVWYPVWVCVTPCLGG